MHPRRAALFSIKVIFLLALISLPGRLAAPEASSAQLAKLKAEAANLPERERPEVLNTMAELLASRSPSESLQYARQAQALAEKHGLRWESVRAREISGWAQYDLRKKDEAYTELEKTLPLLREFLRRPAAVEAKVVKALLAQGLEYRAYLKSERSEEQTALDLLEEARSLFREIGDNSRLWNLLLNIGQTHLMMGEYEKALAFSLEALSEAEQAANIEGQGRVHYLIGYINREMKDYETAFGQFQEAERLSRRAGNSKIVCFALNEIGNIHMFQSDYQKAMDYKERALSEARAADDPYVLSTILHDIGVVYYYQNKYDEALRFFKESYDYDLKVGYLREITISASNMADVYMTKGNPEEAVRLLRPHLEQTEKAGLHRETLMLSLTISQAYAALKDYARALDFLNRAYELRDKIYSEEKSRQIAEMQTRFETKKKEQLLVKSRSFRNALIALVVLALALIGVLTSLYRFKAKANRKLEAANSEIRDKQQRLSQAYKKMEELAQTDALTQLPNRRNMLQRLEEEKLRFERNRRAYSVLMVDLDRFKEVNDTFGHDCGDYLLKSCASVLRGSVRRQDWVGRWGGDEFLLLLTETGLAGGRRVIETIRRKFETTSFVYDGRALKAELSLGMSVFKAGLSVDDCIREADLALYREKRRKRRAA